MRKRSRCWGAVAEIQAGITCLDTKHIGQRWGWGSFENSPMSKDRLQASEAIFFWWSGVAKSNAVSRLYNNY
jgi:hypothetical protein